MARIPERLPFPLSERTRATSALYSPQGREYDVAIGGIPFMLATASDIPQSVETVPVRKDQFDTELDPGEQSLTGFWRRSQASWHEGAGFLYQESGDDNTPGNGFFDSEGVDVFTRGQITLLKAMASTATLTAGAGRMRPYINTGVQKFSLVNAGALWTNSSGSYASLHAPAGKTIVDGLISTTTFYDVASDGTLYQGDTSSPATATTWPLGFTASRLTWGKHRLWVIGGRRLWQPDLTLAAGTAQNPKFTHPNLGWTYTCLAESPQAMLFGGHDGLTSSIQAITLDSGGGLPALSGAAVTAVLPDGELVEEIATLAGQYIAIGTTKGLRIGVMGDDSRITYGPILIEGIGVPAITTQGRFFVAAVKTATATRIYRIDTSVEVSEGVFAYAKDVDPAGLAASSLATTGDRGVACVTTTGVVYEITTDLVSSGWVQSGRIRFRTTEPKSFKYLNLEIAPLEGTIVADLIIEGGSTNAVATLSIQGEVDPTSYPIELPSQRYVSVKLTFNRKSTDSTKGPTVHSFLLRALPAVKPQRLITLPLLCYDYEQARSGQRYGGEGYAARRIRDLQAFEDAASTVVLQDFSDTLAVGIPCVIESMKFSQQSPPTTQRREGAGGILLLQLRTVAV